MRRAVSLLCALALAACQQQSTAPPPEPETDIAATDVDGDYLTTGGDGTNWAAVGFSYLEQRHSPLDRINAGNVGDLGIAWYADLPDDGALLATPLVVDGVIFVTTARSQLFAFDAQTGEELWSYDPEVPRKVAANDTGVRAGNRGVAMWRGKLFMATLDGRLIAIDAKSGARLWEVGTVPPGQGYVVTGAPRVVKNRVVIGHAGGRKSNRGFVSAYDVADGSLQWRFYTTPSPGGSPDGAASDPVMTSAAKTWGKDGQWRVTGGGGAVPDAISYDPELDQLYFGVGPGDPLDRTSRSAGEGDNLFLSSIVAVDPDTGQYLWHYQEVSGDSWGFSAASHIMLADIDWPVAETDEGVDASAERPSREAAEGDEAGPRTERRKVILHAPDNGFFKIIDRTDGRLLAAMPYLPGLNWADGHDPVSGRAIENPQARYDETGKAFALMAGFGATRSMSYNPATGLVYIAVQARERRLSLAPPESSDEDGEEENGTGSWMAALIAFDPVSGEAVWTVDREAPGNGGTLSTAGNLLFQGTALGRFHAYAADSGERLLDLDVQSAVQGPPVTYLVGKTQYVAFLTGRGRPAPMRETVEEAERAVAERPRLIVLKLAGRKRLPAVPKPESEG